MLIYQLYDTYFVRIIKSKPAFGYITTNAQYSCMEPKILNSSSRLDYVHIMQDVITNLSTQQALHRLYIYILIKISKQPYHTRVYLQRYDIANRNQTETKPRLSNLKQFRILKIIFKTTCNTYHIICIYTSTSNMAEKHSLLVIS